MMSQVIKEEQEYYDLLRWLCGDIFDISKINTIKKTNVYDFYLLLEANSRYIKERNKQIEQQQKK